MYKNIEQFVQRAVQEDAPYYTKKYSALRVVQKGAQWRKKTIIELRVMQQNVPRCIRMCNIPRSAK